MWLGSKSTALTKEAYGKIRTINKNRDRRRGKDRSVHWKFGTKQLEIRGIDWRRRRRRSWSEFLAGNE